MFCHLFTKLNNNPVKNTFNAIQWVLADRISMYSIQLLLSTLLTVSITADIRWWHECMFPSDSSSTSITKAAHETHINILHISIMPPHFTVTTIFPLNVMGAISIWSKRSLLWYSEGSITQKSKFWNAVILKKQRIGQMFASSAPNYLNNLLNLATGLRITLYI